RGSQAQPRAARDRAFGGGRSRRLPVVHVDRGGRHPAAPADAASRPPRPGSRVGEVVGPVTGDAHAAGLRFILRNIKDGRGAVPVVYTGTVPDLFKVGRHITIDGQMRNGSFVAVPDSLVTKCPSK